MHSHSNLTSMQKRDLSNLESINDLVISITDKGGQIVSLDKSFFFLKLLKRTPILKSRKTFTNTKQSVLIKTINGSVILCNQMKRSLIPSATYCTRWTR